MAAITWDNGGGDGLTNVTTTLELDIQTTNSERRVEKFTVIIVDADE